MKLYLDTVNLYEIKKYCDVIDGVTTVPTFAVQENINYNEELIIAIKEIIGLKEIHFTILEQHIDKAVKYCMQLKDICDCNLIFKIPIARASTPTHIPNNNKCSRKGANIVLRITMKIK